MLTYQATNSSVTGKDGRAHAINQVLVKRPHTPQGGWKVNLTMNGQEVVVPGGSGQEVFAEAKRLFALNDVPVRDLDLWLTLNIMWIGRVPEKYHVVRVSDLMTAAVSAGNDLAAKPTSHREYLGPAVWGAKGWGMLQQYLALDTYSYGTFLNFATELAKWIDPALNPSRGCSDCFIHYTTALARLRITPLHRQDEARRWLWQTMNGSNSRRGVPIISFEEASKRNYWT